MKNHRAYKIPVLLALVAGLLAFGSSAMAGERYRVALSYYDGGHGYRVAYRSHVYPVRHTYRYRHHWRYRHYRGHQRYYGHGWWPRRHAWRHARWRYRYHWRPHAVRHVTRVYYYD